MNQKEIVEKTRQFVKEALLKEGSGHDYYHIDRVVNMALYIGKKEGSNLFIVELAALLHDISDHKKHDGNSQVGADLAYDFLRSLEVEQEDAERVRQIIATMSYKGGTNKVKQTTIEGMVVQDADRLDAIGAIGIARTFTYGGHKNRTMYDPGNKPRTYQDAFDYVNSESTTINHFYEKLLLLKDLMNTDAAKAMAAKRHEFMENFLIQFFNEWNSNDYVE